MTGASTWSLGEADARRIHAVLTAFLREANARTALLVDRNGQMLASAGDPPLFDHVAFASLTAADFSANDQLARLIGETEFNSLFHQGEQESMYLADIARRVILVILFDNRTTLGLVRLKVKQTVDELTKLFAQMFQRAQSGEQKTQPNILAGAEDEIDKLFQ